MTPVNSFSAKDARYGHCMYSLPIFIKLYTRYLNVSLNEPHLRVDENCHIT